jgi:hypothetical protein
MCGYQGATGAMLLVRRNCGCCGTSVAAVDGRHFDAAVRRKAGATEKLVLRCRRKAGCWSVGVPFLSAFSRQLRGCLDRLTRSKQTAATGQAIWGAKVWSGQCFRGVWSETWREIAHGQPRRIGVPPTLASGVQLAGGAMPAGNAGRIRGAGRVRRRGAERAQLARASNRWRGLPAVLGAAVSGGGAELARSAELLSGRFTEMAAGRAGYRSGMARAAILGKAAGREAALSKNCCKGLLWRKRW